MPSQCSEYGGGSSLASCNHNSLIDFPYLGSVNPQLVPQSAGKCPLPANVLRQHSATDHKRSSLSEVHQWASARVGLRCPREHQLDYVGGFVGTDKIWAALCMSVGWSWGGGGEGGITVNHLVFSSILEFILPKDGLIGPQLAVYQHHKQRLNQGRCGGWGEGALYFPLRQSQNVCEETSVNHRICSWNTSTVSEISMYRQPNGGRASQNSFLSKR